MEKIRYSGNMSDSIAETGKSQAAQRENKGITKRQLFAGAASAGAVAGVGIVEAKFQPFRKLTSLLGEGVYAFFNRPTADQMKAAELLDRPESQKYDYEVTDDPEIISEKGLAVRRSPNIPVLKGESPNAIYRLQPGDKVTGAIQWIGENTTNIGRQDNAYNWLAFKDNQGRIGFVVNKEKYLKELKALNPST